MRKAAAAERLNRTDTCARDKNKEMKSGCQRGGVRGEESGGLVKHLHVCRDMWPPLLSTSLGRISLLCVLSRTPGGSRRPWTIGSHDQTATAWEGGEVGGC